MHGLIQRETRCLAPLPLFAVASWHTDGAAGGRRAAGGGQLLRGAGAGCGVPLVLFTIDLANSTLVLTVRLRQHSCWPCSLGPSVMDVVLPCELVLSTTHDHSYLSLRCCPYSSSMTDDSGTWMSVPCRIRM